MDLVHIFLWILLNIYYVSGQNEKNTFGHCKSSKMDVVCEATKNCCPEGWKLMDEKCYFFEKELQKSLIESQKYCKELNASIFVPNSLAELQKILLNVPQAETIWVGVRKENQVIPHSDIYGTMNMSTLDWNNEPYVEDFAHVSMLMCDVVMRYLGYYFRMQPCGMPFHFVCEKNPEPEVPATASKDTSTSRYMISNVSSGPKIVRTAPLFEVDATGEPTRKPDREDRISSEEEIRRYVKDVHMKRLFYEEIFLKRTEAGEDEEEQTVQDVHQKYLFPKLFLIQHRQKCEEKLKLLREATRDLDVDIKRAEMYLERLISVHDELIETMEDDKRSFCAKLAKLKRERYLKSVMIKRN